ncbi:MAG: hypothetical protein WBM17_09385 [Anaerolineales bacterium]
MTSRHAAFIAGFTGILVIAIALAGPFRPQLARLPADWQALPGIAISVYPSETAYAGDWISVAAATQADPRGRKLQVRLDRTDGAPLAESPFFQNGNSLDWNARLTWVWDSSGGEGWHTLYVTLAGDAALGAPSPIRYPVRVLPAKERPALRQAAVWRQAKGTCCDYFYLSGTEAERDITELQAEAERIFESINPKMEDRVPARGGTTTRVAPADSKLNLVFLPRVYGQGGLAMQEGYISYADRNYTGTDFRVVLEHEMIHLLTIARYGDGPRAPLFFQEGWAVYLTGGHYRVPESLTEKAAALLALGKLAPLAEIADTFSTAQHEAAYIEAGAFVEYLAGRYGRERVTAMLFDPAGGESPAGAMDAMLRTHFGCMLAACEADWLAALRSKTPDPDTVRDVEFTMGMFDLIREYQREYAAGVSIYDLFLPDPARARAEQITADYSPPPASVDATALELMFLAARDAADRGEWARTRGLLAAIGEVLDAKARRAPDPAGESALAGRYRDLAAAVLREGGEPLWADLNGEEASVLSRDPATLEKEEQHWNFVHGSWARGGLTR